MSEFNKRAFLQENRAAAAELVADLSDKIADTATGKKLAKAQAQLAFWDQQLASLPPDETRATARNPESGRASENAVEPTARDENLEMPGFLDRTKQAAHG
jgi:hypothetical protein